MSSFSRSVLFTIAALIIAAIVIWQVTGGDWYTKYEVVEQIESEPDPNDPLAAAGFYEGGAVTQTVTREEFRFGLLPTPSGVFDKHVLSVVSVSAPLGVFGLGVIWFQRRRKRQRESY